MPDGNGYKDPKLVTFGCRMNTYESEVMRDHARAAGLSNAVIVNTCAVTAEAERQARQTIRKLRRENPEASIIVTGCAAQLDPQSYGAMPEVDRVLGNREKLEADSYAALGDKVTDIMAVHETAAHLLNGFEGRARAFVQVQQGCDHRCTFCIIPFARGPNRSVPLGAIVDQARSLVNNGYKEIILTGVDILSYGADLPGAPSLPQSMRRMLGLVPDLERLRLTSLDPAVMDRELLDLIGSEHRIMPHIHLSVQAGDDMILKRMKRRHTRDDILRLSDDLRRTRPGLALGADFIAGFPTETDAMFENTLALVQEAGLSHLHVFPYSPREGTPAANMPQVPGNIAKERAKRLRQAGAANMQSFMDGKVGQTAAVLVEKSGFGHSEHYLPVAFEAEAKEGEVLSVTLQAREDGQLRGTL